MPMLARAGFTHAVYSQTDTQTTSGQTDTRPTLYDYRCIRGQRSKRLRIAQIFPNCNPGPTRQQTC